MRIYCFIVALVKFIIGLFKGLWAAWNWNPKYMNGFSPTPEQLIVMKENEIKERKRRRNEN